MAKITSHDAATIAKAKRMAQRLKDHHALGKKLIASGEHLGKFAKQHGINERTMRNFRAFARQYAKPQLAELCSAMRPNGLPLNWGYVPHLLALGNRQGDAVRRQFQERAVKHGWSVVELQRAVRKKYHTKPGHGRPMKRPSTPTAGLAQLEMEAENWMARSKMIVEYLDAQPPSRKTRNLKKRAAEVAKTLAAVEKAARSATKRLRAP